jgi:hypothetical protein
MLFSFHLPQIIEFWYGQFLRQKWHEKLIRLVNQENIRLPERRRISHTGSWEQRNRYGTRSITVPLLLGTQYIRSLLFALIIDHYLSESRACETFGTFVGIQPQCQYAKVSGPV